MIELRCKKCHKLLGKINKKVMEGISNPELEIKCKSCKTINKFDYEEKEQTIV